jgi:hypothetical protein
VSAEFNFLGDLQGLLAKTVGLVDVVREALAEKNHFLTSVLKKDKLFVIGTPHDLERLAG